MMKILVLLLSLQGIVHSKKNILFLVSDDLRPNLGAYDGPDMPSPVHPPMYTPNIDALAARSLLLKRAYVSVAVCSPSRTALLTSRRPDTSHIWRIGPYFRQYGGNFTTLPEYFKQNGYRTIGMGKVFHPGTSSGNDDPVSWTDPYTQAIDDYKPNDLLIEAVSEERAKARPLQDQLLAEYAIQALKEVAPKAKSGEKNFFLAVGFRKPHVPWNFPARFLDYYPLESLRLPPNYYAPVGMPAIAWHDFINLTRYKDMEPYHLMPHVGGINFTFPKTITLQMRQAYYSCISYMDHELGRVIDELDNLGLTNNTIISFWGDHGWQLGEHSEWQKETNFEDAVHAPMMIHVPGVTDHGVVTEKLTEFVDLYPTLVEAAGLPKIQQCPPDSQNVSLCTEGTSMMPLMTNPTLDAWKTAAFSQYPRKGDPLDNDVVMGYSMRTDMYRYTEWINFTGTPIFKPMWDQLEGVELYDHTKDPEENWNRADDPAYKDVRVELSRNLQLGWRGALPNSRV